MCRLRLLAFAVVAATGVAVGQTPAVPESAVSASRHWRDPAEPALAAHLEAAHASLQLLVTTLSSSVAEAVQDGGPHQGVITCQLQALPLTQQSTAASPPRVIALKRTSLQVRNPANAPDTAEQAALDHVAHLIAAGEDLPSLLVQHLETTPQQDAEIRIYKPLTVGASCLACHGDPGTFAPALTDALALRYPADAATGYSTGDWRGLVRVSLTP